MKRRSGRLKTALAVGLAFVATSYATNAHADVVRIFESDFLAGSNLITFGEVGLGSINPTYAWNDYDGGVAGDPTVNFGGFFSGQMLSPNPAADCAPVAPPTACVVGTPTGPLSLDPTSPDTFTVDDLAPAPDNPVLSGTPTLNGPIAVLFDIDLAGVGFDAGFFNADQSLGLQAFDRDGNLLGVVENAGTGFEFLGLRTDDGTAKIAGVLFSLTDFEPAGFGIDNLRFALEGEVSGPDTPQELPEPGTLPLLALGLLGLAYFSRRRAGSRQI